MNKTFFSDYDFKYMEIAKLLEDSTNLIGKFFIPIVTPTLQSDTAYDLQDGPVITKNIVSDLSTFDIESCVESNYIELKIPSSIGDCKKGDIFIISFLGGEVNIPMIIRKCEDGECKW